MVASWITPFAYLAPVIAKIQSTALSLYFSELSYIQLIDLLDHQKGILWEETCKFRSNVIWLPR